MTEWILRIWNTGAITVIFQGQIMAHKKHQNIQKKYITYLQGRKLQRKIKKNSFILRDDAQSSSI